MRIGHNLPALNTWRQLHLKNSGVAKKLEKLSTGYNINRAADDAAGLAISEKMRAQIRGLAQAARNIGNGIDLIKTAEGGLQETHNILQRMRELAVQSASDTNETVVDRAALEAEFRKLIKEIDSVATMTRFNDQTLLDGSLSRNPAQTAAQNLAQISAHSFATPSAQPFEAGQSAASAQPQAAEIAPLAGLPIQRAAAEYINFDRVDNRTGNGWSYQDGVFTITAGGDFDIISESGDVSANRIVVASGVNANISLTNVNISTGSGAALDMRGATVTMNLVGTNTLTSRLFGSAGVQTTGGTLTIDGTGKLIAQGGICGAGIGGGVGGDGGKINIEGGTVVATGGSGSAGIGGGDNGGDGGNITIEGGTVVATGGGQGAGIGGGWRGDGGNITIEGGTVVATGGNYGTGIGGGNLGDGADLKISGGLITATGGTQYDIGGGPDGSAGTTKITGGNLIADPDKIQGGVKDGSGNPAYRVALDLDGGTFDPNTEVAVTVGSSSWNAVTNSEGKLFLYLNTSANGKEISVVTGGRTYSGTVAADGVKVDHTGAITLSAASYVSGRTININNLIEGQYGDNWSFTGGILTIKDGADLEITGTGAATANRIVVESGATADITLNNVNVSTGSGAALDMRGATVTMSLVGTNTLTSTVSGYAGVQTTGGTLTIDGTGKLIAQGGRYGAGIGGGQGGDGGNITIEGGTVEATGDNGAGIGGGYGGDGGKINIEGGTVVATGGGGSAGIGGGWGGAGIGGGNGGQITISGAAEVTAQGGASGAGIGGGYGGDGGIIKIEGGTVEATGGRSGSGIGGGREGAGGIINIEGGTAVATGGDYGAGIGGGQGGDGGNITIEGGTAVATGGEYGAGIGGGRGGAGGTINISGGIVEATGGDYGAGIGGGSDILYYPTGDGADLTISGGSVTVNDGWIGGGINRDAGGVGADGTTTITGGNLTIDDPTANIHGGVTDGNASAYRVEVQGVIFGKHEEVAFSIGGATWKGIADSNGKFYFYLPGSVAGSEVKITYGGTEYVGILEPVKTDHSSIVMLAGPDTTPPTLTGGSATRDSETDGTVKFTSDEAGEYYYVVVEKGASPPTIDTSGPGTACDTSEQTINLSGLDATKEYDIYILVKDAAGNKSAVLQVGLGAYTPSPKPPDPPDPPSPPGLTGSPSLPIAGGGKGLVLQIGANEGDTLTVYIEGMDAARLGVKGSGIATRNAASAAITTIGTAINLVSTQRAALGAMQNRLEHALKNLGIAEENLTNAESRIRDADMAKEMMALVKQQIVAQAAQAMLAQANSNPQNVLELLR